MINWEILETNLKQCKKCPLANNRTQVLCGHGNKDNKIMFIAEAPGEVEDIKGLPFMGKSGTVLDKLLKSIDLSREDIFITNIVKCHPPKNRNPKPEERELCIKWLTLEVKLLKPSIVVCLGKISAERLIHKNFSINANHGKVFERNGYKFIATFHPSAILRDESKLIEAINDFKIIKQEIDKLKVI